MRLLTTREAPVPCLGANDVIVLLHLLNQNDATGGPVELILMSISTVIVAVLYLALLRMFRDTRPEKPNREINSTEVLRRELRAARRGRNR